MKTSRLDGVRASQNPRNTRNRRAGSCTMKLNATAEMIPITWPEFSDVHPFAPRDQTDGYVEMIFVKRGPLQDYGLRRRALSRFVNAFTSDDSSQAGRFE